MKTLRRMVTMLLLAATLLSGWSVPVAAFDPNVDLVYVVKTKTQRSLIIAEAGALAPVTVLAEGEGTIVASCGFKAVKVRWHRALLDQTAEIRFNVTEPCVAFSALQDSYIVPPDGL